MIRTVSAAFVSLAVTATLLAPTAAQADEPAPYSTVPAAAIALRAVVADEAAVVHATRADAAACATSTRARALRHGAQIVNAFVVGAATAHGATGHTAFGTSPTLGYLASQAAFDALLDRVVRRASCADRNTTYFAVGASALFNAAQSGVRP